MTHDRTALIIGATGTFGVHAAAALQRRGWRLRALARDPAAARAKLGPAMPIDLVAGDALNPSDVVAAAGGTQLIVHAANPPAYHDWPGLVMPMMRATIAAARASGARIVIPGNVYNYAPDAGPMIAEDAPQAPVTRKGAIRVELEEALRAAAGDGVRSLVLRAGDFFGPGAESSMLRAMIVGWGGRTRALLRPGAAGHAWAYLPDLSETLADLAEREAELPGFARFHFAGHWIDSPATLAAALRRVTGDPRLPVLPFPWPVLAAAAPFVEALRELMEMRYLWTRPIGLDGARLAAFLGQVPATGLDAALAATLEASGLLREPDPAPDAAWEALMRDGLRRAA